MKKQSMLSLTMALALAAGTLCVPAQAAPVVKRDTGFGISYVSYSHYDKAAKAQNNMVTGVSTRYECEAYTATLDEMEQKLAEARKKGIETGTPDTLVIKATSTSDAESKIADALYYVPDTIQVQFSSKSDADGFYARYSDWQQGTAGIDLWIQAIDTQDADPLVLKQTGSTVTCTLTYADGWLANADLMDGLRVYEDEAWSEALSDWAETYLAPIKASGSSESEMAAEVAHVLKSTTEYDHATSTYERGSDDFVTIHSMYGPITDGRGVCDGYSYTFHFAAAYLGLPCFEVYGDNHAWNKVKVDGAWYVMDMANIVDSVWMTRNYVLVSDKMALTPYSFLDWTSTLYPCDANHADRDALAAMI